jgi:hypothetical protein
VEYSRKPGPVGPVARRAFRSFALPWVTLLLITCKGDAAGPPPPPALLAFKIDPTTAVAGATIVPGVTVEVRDAAGKLVPGYSDSVTVSIARNPANGVLSGTKTVAAVGGVASFGDLSINAAGTGYRLQATSATLTAGTSKRFDISSGPPTHLAFTVQPGTAVAGSAMAPAVQVAAQDALGNAAADFTGTITLVITGGTGTGGATLAGVTTVAAVAGVSSFAAVNIDKMGTGYAVTASTSGFPSITSSSFDVIPGAAAQLAFTVQPTTSTAGTPIAPAVAVTARDAFGNTTTGYAGTVTLTITSGTGTNGALLSGTPAAVPASGVATLSTLSIDKSGTGYTLSATAPGVTGTTSASFDVVAGAVSQLAFTVQPQSATAGSIIAPAVQVSAVDALGNTVPGFGASIAVAIAANPGGGTLTGVTQGTAVSGVAAFADLRIDKSGTAYQLRATAGPLTASSAVFNIVAGPPTLLAFTAPPVSAGAGAAIAPAVQIGALDSLGNVATSYTGTVTVTLGANPGGATLSGTAIVTAVAGIATFSALSLDALGSGYTLSAATPGLPGATSPPFDVVPGPAAVLVFTIQPTTTTAGLTLAPAVVVTARDAFGNTATGFTGGVSVALGVNPGGGGLSGTKTVAAVAGVATFSDLSIARSGAGYTLTARATGIAAVASTTFDILVGPLSQLAFAVQPATTVAGATIAPAVVVAGRDAAGNTVPTFTGVVTIAIAMNAGGGTLTGTTSAAAVAGLASFGDLSIDKSATGYRLQAVSGVLGDTSAAFSISAGAAVRLEFTVPPSTTGAGVSLAPAVQIAALDALGNVATGFAGAVTIAIGTNPGSGVLSGTTVVAPTGGVATFSGLSINKTASGYTLAATAVGVTGVTSGSFDITAGPATQLAFTVHPGTTTAGIAIAPAIEVRARDVFGNTATSFAGTVTASITTGTGAAGAALTGTKTVGAVAGVATFTDLSINKNGAGYTLTAKSSGLSSAVSASFDILVGPLSQLAFSVDPTTATAGTLITPPVQVTARDAAGNTVTTFTGDVAVSISVNPGGGTLSGTTVVPAVAGVATFGDLRINKTGVGYRLDATAGALTATSAAFSITGGPAVQLAFGVQPATTPAGLAITPAVKVTAQDSLGNTAPGFNGSVTVAIGTNPAGGTLGGTTTLAAVAGVATFPSLTIDKIGTGYTLVAASNGLPDVTSAAFDVTAGGATRLVFTVEPSTTTAGSPITPAVQVTARDPLGNPDPGFSGSVTVAIVANPAGGNLAGTKTVAAVNGVATFSDLSINRNGTGYTLSAKSTGLTADTSLAFDILLGPVSQLVFTTQPTTTSAGTVIAPSIQVAARDAAGNTVPAFTGNVTMTIGVNPGAGTLFGTTTVAAVAGVATFNDLLIDKAATGYRLQAAGGGFNIQSGAFSITGGAATKLLFTVGPVTTAAGAVISPAVKVTAQDSLGNTATSFTGNVAMAIGTNPAAGSLSGTTPIVAVAGVATFSDLSINKIGTGYTLRATATGLTAATSATFNVIVGPATQLAFTVQPGTAVAGVAISPAVKVTARDAVGNTATSFTGNVSVAIGTNPGGGTLSGTVTVPAVAGVATFSTLSIDKKGTGYTLAASASGLTGATSATFTINAGPVSQLGFIVDPMATTAGATITPAVKVAGQDGFGNTVTSFTGMVTVSISPGSGTVGATLSGTTTVSAVAGIATFSTLSIDKSGADYRLAAGSGALIGATSVIFAINAGAATQLSFSQQPTAAVAGTAIAPAVTVSVRDALGNLVKTFTGNVTVAIAVNPGGGTLSGTKTIAAVAGVATFSTLSINKSGTGYRLAATGGGGLSPDTSSAFSITPAAATKLAFTVQPVNTAAAATITPAVEVTAQDVFGNTVTTFTGNITVAISTNPSGGTLTGTTMVAAVAGVASFANLSINNPGTGYKLSAAATGPSSATSLAFNIL